MIVIVVVEVVVVLKQVPEKWVVLILVVVVGQAALLVGEVMAHVTVLFVVQWVAGKVHGLDFEQRGSKKNTGKENIVASGEGASIVVSLIGTARVLCTYCGLDFVGKGMDGTLFLLWHALVSSQGR